MAYCVVMITKGTFTLSFCSTHVYLLFSRYIICSWSIRVKTFYNSTLSKRAKQTERRLWEPQEINNRLRNNSTPDSSQRRHLLALLNQQTKLPSVRFNHALTLMMSVLGDAAQLSPTSLLLYLPQCAAYLIQLSVFLNICIF